MRRWSKATKRSPSTSRTQAQSKLSAAKKARSTKSLPPPTPSEAAFEAALRALDAPSGRDDPAAFIDRVFAQADQYLTDPYSTIGDAPHFHTKIVGVSFEGRQDIIAGLHAGAPVQLLRQPENPHDANAIAVHYGDLQIGFFNKRLAAQIAPRMDGGARYSAHVASLTGGPSTGSEEAKHRGVNIFVERDGAALARSRRGVPAVQSEVDRRATADRVRSALIGDAAPHDAQRAVLERIDAGKNTLAVMGTGRGKSFCFQFSAAMRSFCERGKTLVIYPLRALANDQYEAVRRTLEPLGLRCFRANGSIDAGEREELFAALEDGAWDVVLSTPEFLEFHHAAFAGQSAPSLAVIDEAHHLHESRHRPAYAHLAATVGALGDPQVLALTATAAADAFRRITQELQIEAWVIDPTIRENLRVVDARGARDKHKYLVELLRQSKGNRGKCIVYCNSRGEATTIAKRLRKELGDEVMFYHAKMPNADRLEVERLFREGRLRVVIATSAFGEGIDLPDVADVVLYHLNFDFGEFNQQAGRAGRDGQPANVHLLYGAKDRALNEYLIDLDAPPIGLLRDIYVTLKRVARSGFVRGGDAEIAGLLDNDRIRDRHVTAALRIFADSNLVEVGEDDEGRFVRFLSVSGRIEMERNERYAEGEATREAFVRFAEMALNAPASTLERIINRPIYPSGLELVR
jgi:single-stranded-DNA-specific exonuclease